MASSSLLSSEEEMYELSVLVLVLEALRCLVLVLHLEHCHQDGVLVHIAVV
jgi:hypothetical protein